MTYHRRYLEHEQKMEQSRNNKKDNKNNLYFSRYINAKMTINSSNPEIREAICKNLVDAGALIGPTLDADFNDNNGHAFIVYAKRHVSFPNELFLIAKKIRYVVILAKGIFRLGLKKNQTEKDVLDILEVECATEMGSDALASSPNSPWAQICSEGRIRAINVSYRFRKDKLQAEVGKTVPYTTYLSGFDTIYDTESVERFGSSQSR